MKFLHNPNLPETDVSLLVSSGSEKAYQLADHADLQIFDFGDGMVYLSAGQPNIKKQLEKLGFHVKAGRIDKAENRR